MRPYSGVGILQIPPRSSNLTVQLYADPGLGRDGQLNPAAVRQLTGWLFGGDDDLYLLVTAHKEGWLRVACDDSGKEAWLHPTRQWHFSPWARFLKGKMLHLLPNAPAWALQAYPQPVATRRGATPLTATTMLKVIVAHDDWCYVLYNRTSSGWIRWRDPDGRLLIGLARSAPLQSR